MRTLIKDATIVNEGLKFKGSVLIDGEKIEKVFPHTVPADFDTSHTEVIDATGLLLIPGVIDDQVHFREPGLTHKGEIATESKAAAAGGVTTYMEMPNTNPQAVTQEELQKKFDRAAEVSAVNYSFYMGATNDNLPEVLRTDPTKVCGIKVFMGSSTGNMLVDDDKTLSEIFKNAPTLVATHCEDEATIKANTEIARHRYGENVPISRHCHIRSDEACYKSSSKAVELASKFDTRLHILHLSSAKEMSLFSPGKVSDKKITAEVCVHHLWFDERDYIDYGTRIKWNPAVKCEKDKVALWEALLADKIDVIATDHAPHTLEEKNNSYFKAPSGGPLVQHSLVAMLELSKKGFITIEKVIEKMCHTPADLFRVNKRGYIREGYFADLVLVDPNKSWIVAPENILYKCGWAPFERTEFSNQVVSTFVNGLKVYHNNRIIHPNYGQAVTFNL
ncbi:dihydroorotase [Draconibacterium orientale]|uniref:Dihydroorotase n=1 Tax=Draconibacterium orientale TaxID=1168034 RepID=X5DHP5_9BACT|nr:dihydroorotase [Draconibacterium orientale]AHW60007.1 dihydroorotase [Draconibacterium orientale]SEU09991.1 dihydroorotase [Draconibacterium orientale]